MKVFVIGSHRHLEDSNPQKKQFVATCKAIGTALANGGHELVVGSARPSTADPYVVDGYAASFNVKSRRLTIIRPDPDRVDSEDGPRKPYAESEFPALRVQYPEPQGDHRIAHLRALLYSDAVLAIGGSMRGTATVVYSADVMKKPVALIRGFGGAAHESWRDINRHYNDAERNAFGTDPPGDVIGWADSIVHQLKSFSSRNPLHQTRKRDLALLVLSLLSSLGVWLYCFVTATPATSTSVLTALAGMAFSASIFGTALRRSLLAAGLPWSGVVQAHPVLEWLSGFGLAAVIVLVSIWAGMDIANKSIAIDNTRELWRIGATLSIIALLGAMFVEIAWKRVFERGRSMFAEF